VGLHRLAWDLVGSAWGARQDLYERFHFGHASVLQMNLYDLYNKQQAIAMVRRILAPPASPEQPFPLP
jgi:aromatic ring hydroxylase